MSGAKRKGYLAWVIRSAEGRRAGVKNDAEAAEYEREKEAFISGAQGAKILEGSLMSEEDTEAEKSLDTIDAEEIKHLRQRVASYDKRIERLEKKAAASNIENEALRKEVRRLRARNHILTRTAENDRALLGYKVRYERVNETLDLVRELLHESVIGLPEYYLPKTIDPDPAIWIRRGET